MFWKSGSKEPNIIEMMELLVKQWILDQSITDLKSDLSEFMKTAKESLEAAATGRLAVDHRANLKRGAQASSFARNRVMEEKTVNVFRGTVAWLIPLSILELTALRGAYAETLFDGSDFRYRILNTMKEYTSEFNTVVDMYNEMTGDPKDEFGIGMKLTHSLFHTGDEKFYETGGLYEHKFLSKKVAFQQSTTFHTRDMENTFEMVKDRFQKETIKLFVPLYQPVFNISMADPKDKSSKSIPFNGMSDIFLRPSNGALLFGVGVNRIQTNNAISDSMVSAFSQARIEIGKMFGFEYCMYDGDFIQSFRMKFENNRFSERYMVGFDWIDNSKIECKQVEDGFEIERILFVGSTRTKREGYKLYSIGIGGGDLRPSLYYSYGNMGVKDYTTHYITIPGSNYRLRHFKVALLEDKQVCLNSDISGKANQYSYFNECKFWVHRFDSKTVVSDMAALFSAHKSIHNILVTNTQ